MKITLATSQLFYHLKKLRAFISFILSLFFFFVTFFVQLSKKSVGCQVHDYLIILHNKITFRIMVLIHKALTYLVPQCICELLTDYNVIRLLRTLDLVVVLRIRSRSGEGTLSVCGLTYWNKLPADLRSITTVSTFKNKPKTYLFSQADVWLWCICVCMWVCACVCVY